MATIFEAMETAKDFLDKIWNISVVEIDIAKVVKTSDGWEVEVLYLRKKYYVVVNDNKEVQFYEKKELLSLFL